MKSVVIRSILMAAALTILSARAQAAVTVSISMFENDLDPYGSWVDVPSYGTCWRPSGVSAEWQPYTVGEWAYTDYDWTWVSHDRWGGLPYHYGTWVWVRGYGWVWIPGTVWAPAWVTWCYGDDYVGWAPIPPSINISYSGYFGSPVVVSQNYYVFVPTNRFVGSDVSSVRIPSRRNAEIFRQSRQRTTSFGVSNGVLVNRGPSIQRIEQVAHTRIPRQNISVARVAPTSITAAGGRQGSRLGVIAPAPDRARQFHARSENRAGAATGGEGRNAVTERKTVHEQHPVATEHKTTHEHNPAATERRTVQEQHPVMERKTVQEKHPAVERKTVHERQPAATQDPHTGTLKERHPSAMEHHAPPPPPPHHEETHAPPPQALKHEAPPPHGGGQGNAPRKQEPPKKHEPPPHT